MRRPLVLSLVLLAAHCFAERVRVTTWSLQTPAGTPAQAVAPRTGGEGIQEAAAALRKLNPDVILLQGARNWQMCKRLALALRPANYSVLVCSSFREGGSGAPTGQQVAILSKRKAYFSWSEPWRDEGGMVFGGGYAFAAVQFGQQRVGFFSVRLGEGGSPAASGTESSAIARARASAAAQWTPAVDSFKNWVNNRLGAVVVGGGFIAGPGRSRLGSEETPPAQSEAADANAFLGAPLDRPITLPTQEEGSGATADYLAATLTPNPETLPGVILSRVPATCDLDMNPPKLAAGAAAHADDLGGHPRERANPSASPAEGREAQAGRPIPEVEASKFEVENARAGLKEPESSRDLTESNAPAQAVSLPVPTPQPLPRQTYGPAGQPFWWLATLPGFVALIAILWVLARGKPAPGPAKPALLPASVDTTTGVAASYTVVITPSPVAGTASHAAGASSPPAPVIQLKPPGTTRTQSKALPERSSMEGREAEGEPSVRNPWLMMHLGQWLKQKLVQQLLVDRAELMNTQQAATLKMLKVDERLARIELQIQQQNRAYEQRIEELSRELLAAEEENRELIRARINEVKAEMEAARARLLAQTQEEDGQ